MSPFDIDLDLLDATTDDLAQVGAELADLADHLEVTCSHLHTTWDGAAASAHVDAQARLDAGLRSMRAALADMQQAAGTARDNYTQAADTNTRMWTLG